MADDRLDGKTEFMEAFAGRMDPKDIRVAETGAETLRNYAVHCGSSLNGCVAYVNSVHTATARFSTFFGEVREGYTAYGSIAKDSATDYRHSDGVGQGEMQKALEHQLPETPIRVPKVDLPIPPRTPLPLQESEDVPSSFDPGSILEGGN